MKKSLLPTKKWFWAICLCLPFPTFAQTSFWGGVNAALPLGKLPARHVAQTELDAAVMAPPVFVPLMERLGGEFSIGAPSGGQNQHFELTGDQTIMPGLWLGLGVGRRFEVRAGGAYFRREWSGAFPITVFPFQGTEPQQVSGDLQGEASGVMADAELACFFGNGRFRPYLLGGVRGVFTGDYSNSANIAGFELNLPDQAAETDFSPAVGIGIRTGFANKGFADLGISYGKVTGGDYAPSLKLGVGWYFVGNAVNAQAARPITKACPSGEIKKTYKDIWATSEAAARTKGEEKIKETYDCTAPCKEFIIPPTVAETTNKTRINEAGEMETKYKVTVTFQCQKE
ncbi:MAG: hypothetical protein SFV22_02340 [Saprospiraceae bacterium]|nr:hypothetical protein [Saprospiraceae bacterium]